MKRIVGMFAVLSLALIVVGPLRAGDKGEKAPAKKVEAKNDQVKQKPRAKQPSLADAALKRFEEAGIELSDEQKKGIKDLAAECDPQLAEARKHLASLIPAELRKARQEALAKAKAEGKKPAEALIAFKLTPEQAEAQEKVNELNAEFNKKATALLTDEQRAKLPKRKTGADEKKASPKKKKAAE